MLYDGKQWNTMDGGTESYLTKVRGLRGDCVYACGDNGTVVMYDGKKWNDISL